MRSPARNARNARIGWQAWLTEPVDNAPLVLFRAVFGLLIFLEAAGSIATGWVREVYVDPTYTFPHIGFGWLRPLPGDWMYVYYAVMSVPGLLVMLGVRFRPALAMFTVMWLGVYLGQTTSYNNHYYLLILLCVLLFLTPAAADFSLDASRGRVRRSSLCPRWCIAIFVGQVAIVYFYAAVAKLSPDWLAAKPVEIWMRAKSDYPVLGPVYMQPWFKWCVAYGGIFFDGLVVPMLLWRRTRWMAVALSVFFHVFNSYTFRIGIFPYMSIAFCFFFFPGEEVRAWLRERRLGRLFAPPGVGNSEPTALGRPLAWFLAVYFVLQVLLPVRHLFYPGNSDWTEEGHRMAWRMMLRAKSGSVVMKVVDRDTGERWDVRPRELLSPKQANRVATRPDMLWRFSRILRERYAAEGRDVTVSAATRVRLNGRRPYPLVDPAVDLSRTPWTCIAPLPWIEPLPEEKNE